MLGRDVSEILRVVEGSRPGDWGRRARQLADGIEQSGLIASVDAIHHSVNTGLAEMAAVLGVNAGRISAAIAENSRLMTEIDSAIRAPRQTAAAERFSMGIKALSHGWDDEAIEELKAAIELDRFHAPSHLSLGHALARAGHLVEAAEEFGLSLRYSMPEDPAFGAASAIHQAVSLESAGDRSAAIDALSGIQALFPTCSDAWLLLARMTGDRETLREALRISPELTVLAVAASIEGAEDVSVELGSAADGPVELVRLEHEALTALVQTFPKDFPADVTAHDIAAAIMGKETGDTIDTFTAATSSDKMLMATDVLDAVDRCHRGIEDRCTRMVADLMAAADAAESALRRSRDERTRHARDSARTRRNGAIRSLRLSPALVKERRDLQSRNDLSGVARVEAALEDENRIINQRVKKMSKVIDAELADELSTIQADIEQRLDAISSFRERIPSEEALSAALERMNEIVALRPTRLLPWG